MALNTSFFWKKVKKKKILSKEENKSQKVEEIIWIFMIINEDEGARIWDIVVMNGFRNAEKKNCSFYQ